MDVLQSALASILSDVACRYDLDESALFLQYLGGPQERVKVVALSPLGLTELPVLPAAAKAKKARAKKSKVALAARDTCDYTGDELDGVSVAGLKVLCKSHGLTQGGKKDALVHRLLHPQEGKPKKRGGKKKKAAKEPEPAHTHEDKVHHPGCKACELHGNILDPTSDADDYDVELEEEVVVAPQEPAAPQEPSVTADLKALMSDVDDGCSLMSDSSYMDELNVDFASDGDESEDEGAKAADDEELGEE
jgi:hypothetical protein